MKLKPNNKSKNGFTPLETSETTAVNHSANPCWVQAGTAKSLTGFTMVELIIVTSIIGLLAAIAIPNFLAAQIRAKVSRVKAEQEMLMISLQSYFADKTTYPQNHKKGIPSDIDLIALTTPIAYTTSLPKDLFQFKPPEFAGYNAAQKTGVTSSDIRFGGYGYANYLQMASRKGEVVMRNPGGGITWYCLISPGPDYRLEYDATKVPPQYLIYDPTNGTTSDGDLYTFGP